MKPLKMFPYFVFCDRKQECYDSATQQATPDSAF